MKTVYLVQAHGGQWEDSWTLPVKVVGTEERAKELVKDYQKETDEHDGWMKWHQDNPDKIPEHLNDRWCEYTDTMGNYSGFFECSVECLACEIETYWPSMDNKIYTYEVVEMEDS